MQCLCKTINPFFYYLLIIFKIFVTTKYNLINDTSIYINNVFNFSHNFLNKILQIITIKKS